MKTVGVILLRKMFWNEYPEYKKYYSSRKSQNDYPTDVRVSWVFFVDDMRRAGVISEKTANRATL